MTAGAACGRPLAGLRVLVTRPVGQACGLRDGLVALGAEPVLFPTIVLVSPPDPAPLRRAARDISNYDWLIFTSVNGVDRFFQALPGRCRSGGELAHLRVACIGPATAAAVRRRGLTVHVVPESYVAESLVEALAAAGGLAGRRVLLPRAAGARTVLPERLVRLGARVDEVEAYRAEPADADGADAVRQRLDAGQIHVLTFTSSSTVFGFVEAVGPDVGEALVAAIGPITGDTARRHGMPVHVVASEHTVSGLLRALVEYFTGREAE